LGISLANTLVKAIAVMPKKSTEQQLPPFSSPLPELLSVEEVRNRLEIIFPEIIPDRNILVG